MADAKTKSEGFTPEERAAMKERAKEAKSVASAAEADREVLAKIAEMTPPERAIAERLYAIVAENAPGLSPKTWYGMPAWYKDGKCICFFQNAAKFKTRYGTLGFNEDAKLDDGDMWPVAYALTTLTPDAEAKIAALVKKAAA